MTDALTPFLAATIRTATPLALAALGVSILAACALWRMLAPDYPVASG